MSKFKVGDKVRCVMSGREDLTYGRIYEIISISDTWYRVLNDNDLVDGYAEGLFESLAYNIILTPEEVFGHLRKGTKLQWRHKSNGRWQDCVHAANVQVRCILDSEWRVKPEPEVIELNGKKYREIVE